MPSEVEVQMSKPHETNKKNVIKIENNVKKVKTSMKYKKIKTEIVKKIIKSNNADSFQYSYRKYKIYIVKLYNVDSQFLPKNKPTILK